MAINKMKSDLQLYDKSQDELFVILGGVLTENSGFVRPPNIEELKEIGEEWFNNNLSKFRKVICHEDKVQEYLNTNESLLIPAIIDLISGMNFGVSPTLLAHLIAKIGVEKLCENVSNKEI